MLKFIKVLQKIHKKFTFYLYDTAIPNKTPKVYFSQIKNELPTFFISKPS